MCKWVMFLHGPVFRSIVLARMIKGKYCMNVSSSESGLWEECFLNFLMKEIKTTLRGKFMASHYHRIITEGRLLVCSWHVSAHNKVAVACSSPSVTEHAVTIESIKGDFFYIWPMVNCHWQCNRIQYGSRQLFLRMSDLSFHWLFLVCVVVFWIILSAVPATVAHHHSEGIQRQR